LRETKDRGSLSQEKEEEITAEKLKPKTKYRVVISIKNTEGDPQKEYRFNLRIDI